MITLKEKVQESRPMPQQINRNGEQVQKTQNLGSRMVTLTSKVSFFQPKETTVLEGKRQNVKKDPIQSNNHYGIDNVIQIQSEKVMFNHRHNSIQKTLKSRGQSPQKMVPLRYVQNTSGNLKAEELLMQFRQSHSGLTEDYLRTWYQKLSHESLLHRLNFKPMSHKVVPNGNSFSLPKQF